MNILSAQCSRLNDSLVLVEIYDANPQSQGLLGWDVAGTPVDTWRGITMDGGGCVTRIELQDAGLAILPESVGNLSRLEFADLRRNDLSALPDGFGRLNRLITLDLAGNGLSTLPESIEGLAFVNSIDLSDNRLTSLPNTFGNLLRLRFLYLNRNTISYLPESIGDLSRLEVLELDFNGTLALPESIGNLSLLTRLLLADNRLPEIPATIGGLVKLNLLDLRNNFVTAIPGSLGNMTNLVSLDLSGNSISELPESIKNLSKLEVLNVFRNELLEFPESIGTLSALKVINYGGNNISKVPDNIGDLTRLKELYLNDNNLFDIPESIGRLINLESLWLYNNNLTYLPPSIGQLTKLDYLYVQQNYLQEIPASIGNLNTLNFLYLQNNQLQELPESFGNMVNLKILRIENNDLKRLPASFGGLRSIEQLNLRNNDIRDLPASLVQFADIKSLNVVDNALSFEDLNRIRDIFNRGGAVQIAYSPQHIFSNDTIFYFKKGVRGAIDLGYDGALNDSEYSWFKNENAYVPGPGNNVNSNQLVFLDPKLSDVGTYRAVSGNPNFPLLMVESHSINVKVCDRRSDSLELVRLYFSTNGSNWRVKTNWLVPGRPIDTWSGVTLDALGCVSKVDLAGNMLTGPFPDLQMNTLDTLILANNQLTGMIPNNILVPYIKYVDISGNDLSGDIPEVMGGWMAIENLILANNSMGGDIPPELGDLCELTELQLEGNSFGGELPTQLTMLNNLKKGEVSFANNKLDSLRKELIYFCPYGVEIMANNPGGFEKFVEICGDTCKGIEFEQPSEIPWLLDKIKELDCKGDGCFENNVRSDAGLITVRGLKIIYTRTRCFSGQESFDDHIRLYDCGGNVLENISCNANGICSGLGVLTEAEFEEFEFDIKWNCGCEFTKCLSIDTIHIDEGMTDTLYASDFIEVAEICNPGFYSISSVNNELPGSPPVISQANIGFTYELLIENLITGKQCTTNVSVARGLTGSKEYDPGRSNGPVMIACHPNPVVDFLSCPELDLLNVKDIRVFNLQGMEMPKYVEQSSENLQLNVQSYPPGMYLLVMKTEDRQYLNRFTVIR